MDRRENMALKELGQEQEYGEQGQDKQHDGMSPKKIAEA